MIFGLSFLVLSLQILLALLFEVLGFASFLAMPFAFLGLGAAGVFSYVRYFKGDDVVLHRLSSRYIAVSGLLIWSYAAGMRFIGLGEVVVRDPRIASSAQLVNVQRVSLAVGLGFAVLFFCVGTAMSLLYKHHSGSAAKLYFFDLLGAACGCIAATVGLNFITPSSELILLSLCLFLISFLMAYRSDRAAKDRIAASLLPLAALFLLAVNIRTDLFELRLNPNLLAWDWDMKRTCSEDWHGWNPYSRVSLVTCKGGQERNDSHHFSINNGIARAALLPFDPAHPRDAGSSEGFQPANIAFLSERPRDILIMFAGAGQDMIAAYDYSRGSADITGVELNPLIAEKAASLPRFGLARFFSLKNVHMVVAEGRNYLETTEDTFDAIIYSSARASAGQYFGVSGYTGQYLYTREAFASLLGHLRPSGVLGVVSLNKIKVVAMIKEALGGLGHKEVSDKFLILEREDSLSSGAALKFLFSAWDGKQVLVKKSGFSRTETDEIGRKIAKMGMTFIYTPYYTHGDFKVFEDLIRAEDTGPFLARLSKENNLDLSVPTDDRPFVENMFLPSGIFNAKFWRKRTQEIWGEHPRLTAAGILFVLAALLALLAMLLIAPPLVMGSARWRSGDPRILCYFMGLGLGFIFVETTVMNAFTLVLGNPIYAFSVVLAALLLSAGGGSLLSEYAFDRGYLDLSRASLLSACMLFLCFLALPEVPRLLRLGPGAKFLAAAASIFPVGLCLGMLFPQGMKRLYAHDKELIPWVWGLNGFMSILGSVLGAQLAGAAGFKAVMLTSALLYLALAVLCRKAFASEEPAP